jgi:hypothetical protein
MVLNHRADAVYLNVASAKWQLKNTLNKPDNALVFNDKLPNIVDSYYASSVSNNKVIIEFNQFLLNNKKLIQTLKNNYDIN